MYISQKKKVFSGITICLLLATSSLFAQKTDTLGTGTTINSSEGPIIRSSSTAQQFSYSVYLYTESELIAKGIYPGATIHAFAWQRGTGNYNPTLINGATAVWKISVKNGGNQTKYGTGINVYNYISTGFSNFGSVNFDDAANNLPTLQQQWMKVNGGAPYIYTGGSLEILSDWAITAVPGAGGDPSSTGAINWYAGTTTESRTIRASSSTAILSATTTNFISSANRPNLVITYTAAPNCSGSPTTNTISDSSLYCPGKTYVNLYLSGFKAAPGLKIQWQSSVAGANMFSNIANATSIQCKDTTTISKDYRAVVTCTESGLSSTTALYNIAISSPLKTPISEFFSTGILPSCWSISSSNSNAAGAWLFTGSPTGGATPANNGRSAGTFAWTDNTYKAPDKTLTMPLINLANLTNPQLKFELFSNYIEYPGSEATVTADVLYNNVWTNIFTNKGSKGGCKLNCVSL